MMSVNRLPQQDRSRATRQRLLGATIDCLAEQGWTGTSLAVVATRAGVSRGAAQHHFPTREALFTAAVDHVTELRLAEVREQAATLPSGGSRTEAVVDMLVRLYTGPPFVAALQVWVAASADPALRDQVLPLEARVGRAAHRAALELLDADESAPGVREAVQATLDLARGLGLADLLTNDARRRRRVVRQWARMLDAAL